MVPNRHPHSHQHGTGSITMAADCQRSIGHQRTRVHGMKKCCLYQSLYPSWIIRNTSEWCTLKNINRFNDYIWNGKLWLVLSVAWHSGQVSVTSKQMPVTQWHQVRRHSDFMAGDNTHNRTDASNTETSGQATQVTSGRVTTLTTGQMPVTQRHQDRWHKWLQGGW